MKNIIQISDELGRKSIADAVQVGNNAVSNAIRRGAFPPSWYLCIQELCLQRGLEFNPRWFAMVQPKMTVEAAP